MKNPVSFFLTLFGVCISDREGLALILKVPYLVRQIVLWKNEDSLINVVPVLLVIGGYSISHHYPPAYAPDPAQSLPHHHHYNHNHQRLLNP